MRSALTPEPARDVRWRAMLSAAWVTVVLTMLLRDVHELFRPGLIDELRAGVVGGVEMTEELLLGAALVVEIPVLMVLLAWVLGVRAYRRATLAVAPLVALGVVTTVVGDLDDVFFAMVEVAVLAFAVWSAWSGRPASPSPA